MIWRLGLKFSIQAIHKLSLREPYNPIPVFVRTIEYQIRFFYTYDLQGGSEWLTREN
jgi:hypothetical protein